MLPGDEATYFTIAAKLAVSFVCLLIYMNLAGRGAMARGSAGDQIGSYVLGGIVGGMLFNTQVSVVETVGTILVWASLVFGTSFLKTRIRLLRNFIDGKSILLYKNDRIQAQGLRKAGVGAKEFVEGMHLRGIHNLHELNTVWIEPNGQYTLLKKGETPFGVAVIEDGHFVRENTRLYGYDTPALHEELKKRGFSSPRQIAYAEWRTDENTLQIYPY